MEIDYLLILICLLICLAIIIYHPAKTYGVPAALIFIVFGFLVGNGEVLPAYNYPIATESISQFALAIIIFTGGFHTPLSKIKPVLGEGLMLANIGVLGTAILLGVFVSWVTPLNIMEGLLLGSIVSSTDAAATFSILESKKLKLKYNSDKSLEFESAANDPMALILTLLFINLILKGETFRLGPNLVFFFKQVLIGGVVAIIVGVFIRWLFRYLKFKEEALTPIFILALVLGTTLSAEQLGGNLLIAAYILGLFLSSTDFKFKGVSRKVFDSFSWLAQALMFILLGLQIFPAEVIDVLSIAWLPALFLFLIARPVSVITSYLPFKQPFRKQLFISWIGIKGATPIVFALVPITMDVPNANLLFNIVVIVVLTSMILHGFTLGPAAKIFGITDTNKNK